PVRDGARPLVPGPALRRHGRRGAGAGGPAHATPPWPVHDATQGLRRRAQERGLDHLAVEAEAPGPLGLSRPPGPCLTMATRDRGRRIPENGAGPDDGPRGRWVEPAVGQPMEPSELDARAPLQ